GWGLVASPVFKTGVTRPSRAGWVRFPHSPATTALPALAVFFAVVLAPAPSRAQVIDTTVAAQPAKTLCKPQGKKPPGAPAVPSVVLAGQVPAPAPECRVPLSPRAALVRSLLVPGLGQYQLYRPKAAALFAATEVGAIGMSIKSWIDLDEATAARRDTTVETVLVNGLPVIDPETGLPKTIGVPKNKNLADRRRARRTHLEDWLAAIVFNHLFSGADAWVAANLADFNTNVNVSASGRGIRVAAYVAW
ncbi:MAG: hypothetical protein ABIW94_10990, partial [Gemmatimonadaceae bacterium]